MIDFSSTSCSQGMYIYCFVFYLFVCLCFRAYVLSPYKTVYSIKTQPVFIVLLLTYILTSFYNGDFWHYQAYVLYNDDFWKPSEELYDSIVRFTNANYFLFRVVVWGGATFLLVKIIEKYKLNVMNTLYFFFVMYVSIFDYARVSLAMAILFLGIALMRNYEDKKSFIRGVLCASLIICSFFFHHSMLPIIVMCGLALFPFNINKRIIILSFILFPTLTSFLNSAFSSMVGVDVLGVVSIGEKLTGYQNFEAEDISFLETVRTIWLYATLYIPFLIITYVVCIKNKMSAFKNSIQYLYRVLFMIMLFATGMLFLDLQNQILFYRYLNMSFIPITILFCYLYEHNMISRKTYLLVLIMGFLYPIFRHSKVLLRWTGPLS